MLHAICTTLVLAALLAETRVIRHWTHQHASVQQAAAAPAFQSVHKVPNWE